LSAFRTVLIRWAMMKLVVSAIRDSSAFSILVSVSTSTALVLSSSISILGFTMSARAIAMRCFCPPLR